MCIPEYTVVKRLNASNRNIATLQRKANNRTKNQLEKEKRKENFQETTNTSKNSTSQLRTHAATYLCPFAAINPYSLASSTVLLLCFGIQLLPTNLFIKVIAWLLYIWSTNGLLPKWWPSEMTVDVKKQPMYYARRKKLAFTSSSQTISFLLNYAKAFISQSLVKSKPL